MGQAHLDQAMQEHAQAWDIFSEGAHTAPEQPVPCSITLITKIFLVIFKQSPLCYPPPLTLPQAAPQEGLPLPNPSPFQQLQTSITVYINYKQHIAYTNYKINYSLYLRPPSPAHDHLLVEAVVQHQAVGERQAVRLHGVPGSCNHSDKRGGSGGAHRGSRGSHRPLPVPPPPRTVVEVADIGVVEVGHGFRHGRRARPATSWRRSVIAPRCAAQPAPGEGPAPSQRQLTPS